MISLKFFTLLLAMSLASAFNVPEQGNGTIQQKAGLHPRIINGNEVINYEFAYQVALILLTGPKATQGPLCGGALLSNEWVITAAQCTTSNKFKLIKVQLGMLHLQHPAAEYEVDESSVLRHYGYTNGPPSNIALIRIPFLTFSNRIQPVVLPKNIEKYVGKSAVVSGWGWTSSGHLSFALEYATLEIISNEECLKHYGGNNITPKNICTGHSKKGICVSDIGDPLVIEESSEKIIIGIATFGPKEGCGKGIPDGYTRVDHYLDWIKDTMDLNEN